MGKEKKPRIPAKRIPFEVAFVTLDKEQNDERIKRLTHQILSVVENSRKRGASDEKGITELLAPDFEKSLGI